MKITELKNFINDAIALRNPDKAKIAEYAERMKVGVEFPPIIIGYWPKTAKYGESGIVDGLHRFSAAQEAGLTDVPVESKKFPSLESALTFMYTANMSHGLPVDDKQRNKRIVLLKQIDAKLTLEQLGKEFGLSTASIDRILKNRQGEGKPGPKGANARKEEQQPKKASQIFKTIQGLNVEFLRKRPNQAAELGAFCSPVTEDAPDGEVNQDMLQELILLHDTLKGIIKELK